MSGPALPAPRSPAGPLRGLGKLLVDLAGLYPAVWFVLLFALIPLVGVFLEGVRYGLATGGLASVLVGPGRGAITRGVLSNSAEQGALSATLAVAWGYPVGTFLGRHRFAGRDTLLGLLLVPFLLPVLVVVLGVQELFGPSGLVGGWWSAARLLGSGLPAIITVNVFYNVSLVALFTVAGVESASSRLEEAVATLGGGPWRVYRDVWARPSLLGAAAGGLLTFLFSFLSFAPPLILGGYANWTVEDWIYSLFGQTGFQGGPPGAAALFSFWIVLLLLGPSLIYLLLVRQVRTLGLSSGGRPHLPSVPWKQVRTWPFLALTGALLAFVALLLGSVFVGSFALPRGAWGTSNWALLFSSRATSALGTSTASALGNSLFFAALVLSLILLLGILAGFARLRHPRAGTLVDLFSFVPLLLSPVILALSLFAFYDGTLYSPAWVWVLIVGGQAALALPFGLQTLSLAFRSLPAGPREAATTLGAGQLRAHLDIVVPQARPALLTASLFAFAISLGEFTATNFLYLPAYATLPVEMFVLSGRGFPVGVVSALGGLLALLSLLSFVLILGVGRRVRL